MKNSIYILFIAACFVLYSCGRSSMNEEKMSALADSVIYSPGNFIEMGSDGFSKDSLSDEQREVFGKRAIQKLEDYYGFLEIISNTKYDTTLRNQARAIAEELFSDRSQAHSILDSLAASHAQNSGMSIRNISLSSMPKTINDSIYRGSIRYEAQRPGQEGRTEHIDFIIRKINKRFGTEERLVWETYLELK